jgi:hypothetical protein
VAKVSPLCTKVVVVELKRLLVEKKIGKRGSRWPAGQALTSTLPQLSPFTSSCSPHAQTTNQKHQK